MREVLTHQLNHEILSLCEELVYFDNSKELSSHVAIMTDCLVK